MKTPDLSGVGQAWKVKLPEKDKNGNIHGTICEYLVKGPWHPFWDTWVVLMLHLRELPGLATPVKDSPDQTHEFMILSLDPGEKENRKVYDPENMPEPLPFLQPVDVAVRFVCDSDAKAADICEAAVKMIMSGAISPDQDFRSMWKEVILKTAACEKHPENNLN